MTEHVIKVQQPYFAALLDGSKPFEVRRNDRGYQRGDTLVLREFETRHGALRPTGRAVSAEITVVYSGDPRFGENGGLQPGFVVLGLGDAQRHTAGDDA